MSDILARIGVHRPVDVAVFVAAAAALAVVLLLLPGCGGTTSLQNFQLAEDTPAPDDPRHTISSRVYTTWCAKSETCVSVVTERVESGDLADWSVPPPTPMFPRERPAVELPTPCGGAS